MASIYKYMDDSSKSTNECTKTKMERFYMFLDKTKSYGKQAVRQF